jgi:hypothetical protein
MDSTVWVPLVSTIVGAVLALLGGVLSPLVGARRAHEQWLRDKRAELCERYFSILKEAEFTVKRLESLQERYARFPEPSRQVEDLLDEHTSAADEVAVRLRDAASALAIYASPELSKQAATTSAHLFEAANVASATEEGKRIETAQRIFRTSIGQVEALIRKELGADR